jgi:zinc protease
MLFCRSTLPGAPTALLLLSLMGPTAAAFQSAAPELHVAFEKHVLPNGLQVVIHEDHAAPVVAVYVSYHVGSAREEIGRSGFAHLFEHMLFQGSEHVGDDQHFKLVSEAGGTLNGTTNLDRTLYFETLPSNQLELALWLESDRMGFLLPAMTQEKLDNQREVVRNERRQNYENRPYGQASAAIAAALFPTGHPYSWLTIGTHEDLEAATLEDVSAFFERWYGPNNATLAIGGDVDPAEALALAEKWFGGLPRGPEVPTMAARPAALERDVRIVLEDRVRLPRLIMTWPSAEQHTPDSLALELLAMVLSENKSSVLDRALTVDELLAREVFVSNQAAELAGRFAITATAAPGVELGTLEARIRELLANLAAEGIAPEVLERMKSRFEADFVRSLETVSGRTARLAVSNTFTGDPDHFLVEMRRTLELEPAEVQAALEQYLVGRPAVVASVVPEGQRDLAAPAPPETPLAAAAKVDRDARPGPGPAPAFHTPPIWHDRLENGVTVTGTPFAAAPITTLELCVPGGRSHESMETLGISTLVAALMAEGTRELSTTELTDELDLLGASLRIRADDDEIAITLTALDRNLERAAELLADIVLEPRFEAADFERLKQQRLTAIDARSDNIRLIASDVWNRLNRGDESVLGRPSLGTRETIEALTRDDVLAFHRRAVVPAGARLLVVGDLDAERTRELTRRLASEWSGGAAAAEPV